MKITFQNLIVALLLCWISGSGCEFQAAGPQVLRIDSEPSEATLSINGVEVGRTPKEIKLPPYGKHIFRFSKEGYLPVDKVLDIGPHTAEEFTTKLTKLTGLLLFESTPDGAELWINGAFRAKTPVLITDLPLGSHKAEFKMSGFDTRPVDVDVHDRIPQLVLMRMKSIFATLSVKSDPSGAKIIFDGADRGVTPALLEDVIPGEHSLKLELQGFKPYDEKLTVSKAEDFPIKIDLKEILASIEVSSTPSEASVQLDGVFKGRTPMVISGLKNGEYTLTLEKPGFIKLEKPVAIRNKEDAKVDEVLQKSSGTLKLEVDPKGSKIVIANTEFSAISGSDPYTVDLPPGTYDIKVSRKGYSDKALTVQIEMQKVTTPPVVKLIKVFTKDTIVTLKDGRTVEGMLLSRLPNGNVKLEVAPGIPEEFESQNISSVQDKPLP